ncbi:MAG: hypothetical protein IPN69_05260 [Acidobacteria bacterium]|nr:hypothetical protein [Acidobacteriota bacterium]MBK8148829.1 hypothetical protein [Acidobacteriota bacterium]MBK8810125.1 hypothetical protein [Acidobacteriota bacterium]
MGAYEQWERLTPAEKAVIASMASNPLTMAKIPLIKMSKDTAFAETTSRFGSNGHNDRSDAFRHCFWSAILSRDIGYYWAKSFTTAHESNPGQPPEEKEMDLHNNSVGLNIGFYYFIPDSNTALSDKCFKALQNGELKVLVP